MPPLDLTNIFERYPYTRMLNKQMERNTVNCRTLDALRVKALRKQDWNTAEELDIQLAWCRNEGTVLNDQMLQFLKLLKEQGIEML